MMKRMFQFLVFSSVLFIISACSSTGDQEEVFDKMLQKIDTYESMHTKIYLDQYMKENDELEERQLRTLSNIALTREPFTMHQTINVDAGKGEDAVSNEEIYITEQGMFVQSEDEWIQFPPEMHEMMIGNGNEFHTIIDLEVFQDVLKEMKIEETGKQYILRFSTTDQKKHDDLMRLIAASSVAGQFQMEEAMAFDALTVDRLRLELYVDKETYDLNMYNLDLEFDLTFEDIVLSMVQHTETEITEMNKIEPIETPQDVLDNAVDFEQEMQK
ncbi:MAG TPA: DUF6612 family protein [Savagea sp.]